MAIYPLNHHYAIENNPTIFDEEALTALELVGRTMAKVNEVVKEVNDQEQATNNRLSAQDAKIVRLENESIPGAVAQEVKQHLENGDLDESVNEYMGNIEQRVDNLLNSYTPGSTTLDAEIIDARATAGGQLMGSVGQAHRSEFQTLKNIVNGWHATPVKGYRTWPNGEWNDLEDTTQLTLNHFAAGNEGWEIRPLDLFYSNILVIDFNMTKTTHQGGASNAGDCVQLILDQTTTDSSGTKLHYCYEFEAGAKHIEIDMSKLPFVPKRLLFIAAGEDRNSVFTLSGFTFFQKKKPAEDANHALLKNDIVKSGFHNVAPWNCSKVISHGGASTVVYDKIVVYGADNYGIQIPVDIVDTSKLVHLEVDVGHEKPGAVGSVYVQTTANDYTNQIGQFVVDNGAIHISFDPAYYAVYGGGVPKFILLAFNIGGATATSGYFANLNIFQNPLIESGLGDMTVRDILVKTTAKKPAELPETNYLVDGWGKRYYLSINENQELVAKRTCPDYIWLAFGGNSLVNGLDYSHGMAASNKDASLFWRFYHALESNYATVEDYTIGNLATWENASSVEEMEEFEDSFADDVHNCDADITVLQMGDNINTPEKLERFRTGCKRLIQKVRGACRKTRVVVMGAWYQTQEKMDIMVTACKETGVEFVNIWDLNTPENCAKIGDTYNVNGKEYTITDAGHASHPNDAGHKAIANRLLYKLGIVDTENYYK